MRVVERILSLLLAVAVILGSVVLALEVLWAAFGHDPLLVPWKSSYARGNAQAWDTPPVRIAAVVLVVIGLLLLLAELTPRRTPRLQMTGSDPTIDAAITRRSLRSALLNATRQVDGVSSARVTVSRRKAIVTASSRLGSADTAQGLTGELETALRERLDSLQLAKSPKLRTRVNPRRQARST